MPRSCSMDIQVYHAKEQHIKHIMFEPVDGRRMRGLPSITSLGGGR